MKFEPRYFRNQSSVDKVEIQLFQKSILRKVAGPFTSGYCLRFDERFVKYMEKVIPKQRYKVQFIHNMPNITAVLEMQHWLHYIIEIEYPRLSEKEKLIIEKIVCVIIDRKCFAIPVDDLITLTPSLSEQMDWEEIEPILKELKEKNIVQEVDDERWGKNNELTRDIPKPRVMLRKKFITKTISSLNSTYQALSAITTKRESSWYIVRKEVRNS